MEILRIIKIITSVLVIVLGVAYIIKNRKNKKD